jgi:23S rRNA (guanosine2251-2'-O)-methyltransferase
VELYYLRENSMNQKQPDEVLVGRNPVLEALKAGTKIEKIFLLHGIHGGGVEKIYSLAKQRGILCAEISKEKLLQYDNSNSSQGVVALIGQKEYVEVDEILDYIKSKKEIPFLLILDEIEDPQNLGAIIRTAECVGVHGVIIPKHHAASISSTVIKSSAGAVEHMHVAKVTNIANIIDDLKANGVWIVGTDSSAEKYFSELDYKMPLALVIGSEGRGMRRLVKEKCDFLVKIPLYGKIESLNASVAAALVMYEVVRNRK